MVHFAEIDFFVAYYTARVPNFGEGESGGGLSHSRENPACWPIAVKK